MTGVVLTSKPKAAGHCSGYQCHILVGSNWVPFPELENPFCLHIVCVSVWDSSKRCGFLSNRKKTSTSLKTIQFS